MTSDRTLKRWYRKINKKFFYNELTNKVCVQWGDEQDDFAYEEIENCYGFADRGYGRHEYIIILNREKCSDALSTLGTLIHEMIHLATGLRDNHGPVFEAWRQKLGDRGIFKKHALRRNATIF